MTITWGSWRRRHLAWTWRCSRVRDTEGFLGRRTGGKERGEGGRTIDRWNTWTEDLEVFTGEGRMGVKEGAEFGGGVRRVKATIDR